VSHTRPFGARERLGKYTARNAALTPAQARRLGKKLKRATSRGKTFARRDQAARELAAIRYG
jgi:hypothetical protein